MWPASGGTTAPPHGANATDASGRQVTYCYLDDDPVATAERLGEVMRSRWASGDVTGLLAAPFYTPVPFEWTRYLPGGVDADTANRAEGRAGPRVTLCTR